MKGQEFRAWLDLIASARSCASGVVSPKSLAATAARCAVSPRGGTPEADAFARTLEELQALARAAAAAPKAAQPALVVAIGRTVAALDAWPKGEAFPGLVANAGATGEACAAWWVE